MWICIAHRREYASNGYRFPYVGADLRLTSSSARHQPTLLFPTFAGYSFHIPTEGWLRLSRPACLVLRRSGLSVQRRSSHPGTNYIV